MSQVILQDNLVDDNLRAESDSLAVFEFSDGASGNFHEFDNPLEASSTSDEGRLRRVLNIKIEYMPSPFFEQDDIAEEILAPMPVNDADVRERAVAAPPGTPPYLAALYGIPLLTKEQEHHLFRKMNFLKYQAAKLREQLDFRRPQTALLDQIETLLSDALEIRNEIVRANLRLVVSIAKKLVDFANSFDEIVSEGNVPLLRAAEIFDFERGTRFSTYATWAIRNSLYRLTPRSRRLRNRFLSGSEAVFDSVSDHRGSYRAQETYHRGLKDTITEMLSSLDHRDRLIVVSRFGLDESDRAERFREIAEKLGISTERVRQLLGRSLRRLREMAESDQFELEF